MLSPRRAAREDLHLARNEHVERRPLLAFRDDDVALFMLDEHHLADDRRPLLGPEDLEERARGNLQPRHRSRSRLRGRRSADLFRLLPDGDRLDDQLVLLVMARGLLVLLDRLLDLPRPRERLGQLKADPRVVRVLFEIGLKEGNGLRVFFSSEQRRARFFGVRHPGRIPHRRGALRAPGISFWRIESPGGRGPPLPRRVAVVPRVGWVAISQTPRRPDAQTQYRILSSSWRAVAAAVE